MTSQISEPVVAQEIKPRHMTFPLTELNNKYFFGGNPLLTAYIAALSATFPAGEAEFIESIRLYKDKIEDPWLLQQIKGFIGQEGHHSHQHKKINKAFTDHGIDATRIENHLYQDIRKYTSQDYATPKLRLAVTAGMEHMTAILSQYILTHPEILEQLEEPVRDLILWHCVEEIEHKSVAFDVFMLCENDQKYLQKIQLIQTAQFAVRITAYTSAIAWWSKELPSWKQTKAFAKFMFGKNGMVPGIRRSYMDYYRKDFHPEDHKTNVLIKKWQDELRKPEQQIN